MVKSPKVSLDEVKISKLALTEAYLVVVLNIANPNDINFDVKNVTYTLDINSKKVTSAKLTETVEILAQKTTSVSLPLTVKYADILTSAIKLLKKEGLPYHINGSADVGPFTLPFDKDGILQHL